MYESVSLFEYFILKFKKKGEEVEEKVWRKKEIPTSIEQDKECG